MNIPKLVFKMMGGEHYRYNNNRSVTPGRNTHKITKYEKKR